MAELYLVSANRDCPACKGKGWILTTWTGGDLFSRRTVPSYAQCWHCDGLGLLPEREEVA